MARAAITLPQHLRWQIYVRESEMEKSETIYGISRVGAQDQVREGGGMYSTVLIFFFSALRQRMMHDRLPPSFIYRSRAEPNLVRIRQRMQIPIRNVRRLTLDKLASNLRNKPRQQTIFRTQQKTSSLA